MDASEKAAKPAQFVSSRSGISIQLCRAALSKSAPVGYGARMMVFMIPL
jgi:hypothetical protein